ncbi:hypothetical protein PENTCL1PPCAC_11406, partial [Pristionchus entomophagus]
EEKMAASFPGASRQYRGSVIETRFFLMLHQRTDAIRYPHETEDGSTKEVRLGCVLLPHQDDYDFNSRAMGYVIIKR